MSDSIIISVRPDGQGFVVMDGSERTHHASDEAALGKLIANLTRDASLPKVRVEPRDDFVGIVAGLARRLAPTHTELVDAAEPMAHHLTTMVKKRPPGSRRSRRVRGEDG